jgi:hypothetical protein
MEDKAFCQYKRIMTNLTEQNKNKSYMELKENIIDKDNSLVINNNIADYSLDKFLTKCPYSKDIINNTEDYDDNDDETIAPGCPIKSNK